MRDGREKNEIGDRKWEKKGREFGNFFSFSVSVFFDLFRCLL